MNAFEKWVEDYALMYEREITKADCEAAFRAGMRAAEIANVRVLRLSSDEVLRYAIQDILAEADK